MASQLYPILFRDPLLRAPKVPDPLNTIAEKERQTICEVLLSEASSRENTNTIGLAQPLRSRRLGFSPRRPRSLDPVDKIGQLTGAGRAHSWPRLERSLFQTSRSDRPWIGQLVDGSPETIPDAAPWLLLCPGILSPIWRYEEANDGHEGIVKGASKENFYNIAGEPDEEPETKGIPRNIVIPFHPVCTGYGSSFTLPVPERRSSAQLKGIPPVLRLQSFTFYGAFLDARASAVYAATFFIGTFAMGAHHPSVPKLALMGIFGTIVMNVFCSKHHRKDVSDPDGIPRRDSARVARADLSGEFESSPQRAQASAARPALNAQIGQIDLEISMGRRKRTGHRLSVSLLCLCEHLVYHESLELIRSIGRPARQAAAISAPVEHESDSEDSDSDTHGDLLVYSSAESAANRFTLGMSNCPHIQQVTVVALRSFLTLIDEITPIMRELCGQTTFRGYDALHHEFMGRE
ncbi:hypothetical protein DFH08DRAFT_977139 [Mycena albidolilacea]|uniref:Putative ER transporter 6TM N-terminal domain-containing protein n=1 Tax=Mycena albidolilacea TaxID=1033008 RepID=A0AAD6Z272_9AGAR|nr:hypothetical protein DFH08DRAFT_977139 [Mycena albidolilacea]